MLSRARAVSSDRFVNETRLTKLARIPRFGDRDIWTNAFAADESALLHGSRRRYSNPQLSKVFRSAPPNATFPQTDHSLDGMQRRMRALASLTNKLKACGHIDDVLGLFQAD